MNWSWASATAVGEIIGLVTSGVCLWIWAKRKLVPHLVAAFIEHRDNQREIRKNQETLIAALAPTPDESS